MRFVSFSYTENSTIIMLILKNSIAQNALGILVILVRWTGRADSTSDLMNSIS